MAISSGLCPLSISRRESASCSANSYTHSGMCHRPQPESCAGLRGLGTLIGQAGSRAPPEQNRHSRVTSEGFKIPRGSMFEECWGRQEGAQFVLRMSVAITR